MKLFFLTALMMVIFAGSSLANDNAGTGVLLPVRAQIINLTHMPVEEAIQFCNNRNMSCPAIREKYEAKYAEINDAPKEQKNVSIQLAQTVIE